MAEASILVAHEQFNCPVCLDLLTNPVTIHCGHSFCLVCINDCWDQEDKSGVYSCPQCRETFTPRPVLRRNNMLAEVVEKLKKTNFHASSTADECYTGPGDVECDFCTGKKHKAAQSCLVCVVSMCERHLKPHLEVAALKKHALVTATTKLHEKICSQHDEVLKIYCRTDQSCICCLCMLDEHKGHDTVTAKAERTEKQSNLKEKQKTLQHIIHEKQEKVDELKQTMVFIMNCAQAAVQENDRVFTEQINSLEKKRSEVAEQIRNKETIELNRAKRLMKQLEQEISDLETRINGFEQLFNTQDHIHFLQSWQELCESYGCTDSVSITSSQHSSFDGLRKSLLNLRKRLEDFCMTEFDCICLYDFCCLTLDPNTAHRYLCLSENKKVLTWTGKDQNYTDHPERFESHAQVMCKEKVTGCCYWEMEWSGDGGVFIAIAYKKIARKGSSSDCVLGCNKHSWSLRCSNSSLSFWHNNIETKLCGPLPSKIAVYVNHSAGTLFFYNVSKTMTLIHSVQTKFSQPIYAGFAITFGSLTLCQ